jgi:NmrA-like family
MVVMARRGTARIWLMLPNLPGFLTLYMGPWVSISSEDSFSLLEWSIGELEVLHFNSKARVNDYLIESGIQRTSIYTAAYYENFENQLRPERAADGSYTLNFNFIPPDAQFFAFAGSDIGAFALAAFSDPEQWAGKDMKVCTEWATVRKWAKEASEETGLDVRALECNQEDLEKSAERGPWAKDLYLMNLYYIRARISPAARLIAAS